MKQALLRFYTELSDFLPAESQSATVSYLFTGKTASKDPLEAYLRMMGFDSLYRNDYADSELVRRAHIDNEGSVLAQARRSYPRLLYTGWSAL